MLYKNIELKWLGHAGFLIKNEKIIYIDPYQLDNKEWEKADILFITHSHYDHCSIEDIKKIIKQETIVVCGSDVQSKLGKVGDNINIKIVEPGKSGEINGIVFSTVPAYNIGKVFHKKNEGWMGYIIEVNDLKIYHTRDSDVIPEMNTIKTEIALLPVCGKFTMNADEAVRAAEIIEPKLAIPMHYGSIIGSRENADKFVNGCEELRIEARILERE